MGIRNLNRYLRDNCSESIKCIKLSDLSGKRVVVDISIYLYKYEAENALLENMYLMLSIFRNYNIIPIFIFDGKPPPEKKELLQKRREERVTAQEEYEKLKDQLVSKESDKDTKKIINAMDKLKRQIIFINKEKIESVKGLLRAYGATYYDAPGEADEICALLVIQKKVWACLSEDMDLFVYGCTRVLRYLSLINHSVVLYYTKGMLGELKMTQKEFKEICVLSGTDYNIDRDDNDKINLRQTLKYFIKYREAKSENFYKWLMENTDYIINYELLIKINKMFNLENSNEKLNSFSNIKIVNGPIKQDDIKNIMEQEDFIFL